MDGTLTLDFSKGVDSQIIKQGDLELGGAEFRVIGVDNVNNTQTFGHLTLSNENTSAIIMEQGGESTGKMTLSLGGIGGPGSVVILQNGKNDEIICTDSSADLSHVFFFVGGIDQGVFTQAAWGDNSKLVAGAAFNRLFTKTANGLMLNASSLNGNTQVTGGGYLGQDHAVRNLFLLATGNDDTLTIGRSSTLSVAEQVAYYSDLSSGKTYTISNGVLKAGRIDVLGDGDGELVINSTLYDHGAGGEDNRMAINVNSGTLQINSLLSGGEIGDVIVKQAGILRFTTSGRLNSSIANYGTIEFTHSGSFRINEHKDARYGISGQGSIVNNGTGTLHIAPSMDSFAGTVVLNNGTVCLDKGAIAAGRVQLNNGTLRWEQGNDDDLSSHFDAIQSGGQVVLDVLDNNITFGNKLSGGGLGETGRMSALTKNGSGALILTQQNDYIGNIQLNDGQLVLDFRNGPQSNILAYDKSTSLALNGAIFVLQGDAGADNVQRIGALDLTLENTSFIVLSKGAGETGTLTLSFDKILTGAGSVMFYLAGDDASRFFITCDEEPQSLDGIAFYGMDGWYYGAKWENKYLTSSGTHFSDGFDETGGNAQISGIVGISQDQRVTSLALTSREGGAENRLTLDAGTTLTIDRQMSLFHYGPNGESASFTVDGGGTLNVSHIDVGSNPGNKLVISSKLADNAGTVVNVNMGSLHFDTEVNATNIGDINIFQGAGLVFSKSGNLNSAIVNRGKVRFEHQGDFLLGGSVSDEGGTIENAGPGRLVVDADLSRFKGTLKVGGGIMSMTNINMLQTSSVVISDNGLFEIAGNDREAEYHLDSFIFDGETAVAGANKGRIAVNLQDADHRVNLDGSAQGFSGTYDVQKGWLVLGYAHSSPGLKAIADRATVNIASEGAVTVSDSMNLSGNTLTGNGRFVIERQGVEAVFSGATTRDFNGKVVVQNGTLNGGGSLLGSGASLNVEGGTLRNVGGNATHQKAAINLAERRGSGTTLLDRVLVLDNSLIQTVDSGSFSIALERQLRLTNNSSLIVGSTITTFDAAQAGDVAVVTLGTANLSAASSESSGWSQVYEGVQAVVSLDGTSTASFNGVLTLNFKGMLLAGFADTVYTFKIFDAENFGNLDLNNLQINIDSNQLGFLNGQEEAINQLKQTGTLQLTAVSIPETSSAVLLLGGLGVMALRRRRACRGEQ